MKTGTRIPDYLITDKIGDIVHYFEVYGRQKKDTTKHLFTTVFFKMPGSDPDKFERKYMTNFRRLVKDIGKMFGWFKLRVYCDDTIFEDIADILELGYVEIFKYHVPQLFDTKHGVHYSHIGTMMRFYPLFNLANHTAEIVVDLDIDNNLHATRTIILRCMKERKNFCYRTRHCYNVIGRMYPYFKYDYPIIASFMYINTKMLKLPPSIIGEFYKSCILGNDARYTEYIAYNEAIFNEPMGKYGYGVDEYFLNTYLLRYIYKQQIPYYVFINTPDTSDMLAGYIPYIKHRLATKQLVDIAAVNRFTELFAETIGAKLSHIPPTDPITRLEALNAALVPFGTVQPVKDQTAKRRLEHYMMQHQTDAHLTPNLKNCVFNNFSFDKAADMIKRIVPTHTQKSHSSSRYSKKPAKRSKPSNYTKKHQSR